VKDAGRKEEEREVFVDFRNFSLRRAKVGYFPKITSTHTKEIEWAEQRVSKLRNAVWTRAKMNGNSET